MTTELIITNGDSAAGSMKTAGLGPGSKHARGIPPLNNFDKLRLADTCLDPAD